MERDNNIEDKANIEEYLVAVLLSAIITSLFRPIL